MAWETPSRSRRASSSCPFPWEVGEVRLGVWVGDADVDDAPDAGPMGRLEHHLRFLDAPLMGSSAVVDPDPVGVEEGVGAPEGLGEPVGLAEVEGVEFNLLPEGVGPVGMSGDGLDPVALFQQLGGDVHSGVAGGARYRVPG